MTVGRLKQILQDVIDELDSFEDNVNISMQSNTYFVRNARYFFGCNEGYLSLDDVYNAIDEDEDDYDDE